MKGIITSAKTFRYFTHGNPTKATHIVYVLHGYGQLAEFFIRKFQHLSDAYFIVAPEGMHRFYLSGSSGRVGASWMTKEERETDIQDNLNWLNALDTELCAKYTFEKKHLIGFSQGGPTAIRWQFQGNLKADQLIVWASVFPPDLELNSEIRMSKSSRNYFVIGEKDEFYSLEQQNEVRETYELNGFISLVFDGQHDIEPKLIQKLVEEL
jgi:predicted esterase